MVELYIVQCPIPWVLSWIRLDHTNIMVRSQMGSCSHMVDSIWMSNLLYQGYEWHVVIAIQGVDS